MISLFMALLSDVFSVNRAAAVNLTWHRVLGTFELPYFTIAQVMLCAYEQCQKQLV